MKLILASDEDKYGGFVSYNEEVIEANDNEECRISINGFSAKYFEILNKSAGMYDKKYFTYFQPVE